MQNKIRRFFFFLVLLVPGSLLLMCTKEGEVITEIKTVTVVKTDTVTIIDTVMKTVPDSATVFVLVRHAETTGGGDPNLSAAGEARAAELSRILAHVPLQAVFSTGYNRTRQTALPTAGDKSLPVELYDANKLNAFADTNLIRFREGIILVVGHSNTTPQLLGILTGTAYPDIPETEYDNLYLVTVYEKGRAKVIHIKYGE